MKKFMIGVNYWASHAGADMWRDWDEETVRRDFALLQEEGVRVLRVFPNWRDFQPVKPLYGGNHAHREYRMEDDRRPVNPWYLDPVMMERFHTLCGLAEAAGLKLIVGLITGWMSGRLYVPAALYEKNLYTDSTALYFQQLFLRGFVKDCRNEATIVAWDLGNECNCMDKADRREAAANWTSVVVNAIRAEDGTRPVVSGMHSLEIEGVWTLQDQGMFTDMLTTHPYPFWMEHGTEAALTEYRTLLQATAQTQYYAAIGGKPCLVEEIGSMGPMICDEENAARFLKVNLWSNWAHGAPGLLWWCAFEQQHLTAPPYDWNMCERELGMVNAAGAPKPVLKTMGEFGRELEALESRGLCLPPHKKQAVCVLTQGQDHWGIAYMSYLLAKQAGITLDFAYGDFTLRELPEAPLYILPSTELTVMDKEDYEKLKKKTAAGADLLICAGNSIFADFEELTGFRVIKSRRKHAAGSYALGGETLHYDKDYALELLPVRAEVLASDAEDLPLFGKASYGKGTVWFLNFPLEKMLLNDEEEIEKPNYKVYETVAAKILENESVHLANPYVGLTIHEDKEIDYAVLINYSDRAQTTGLTLLAGAYTAAETLCGDPDTLEPFGTAILALRK